MRKKGTFAEFLAHPDVTEEHLLGGRVGFMAFHAGLEEGTGELARDAAEATGASLYVAEQAPHVEWHISSQKVTADQSERLAEFMDHVDVTIALHGYGRPHLMRSVLLGGQHRWVAEIVAVELIKRLKGYEILHRIEEIPQKLRGLHENNPVNAARQGGVQVELPPRPRMQLPDWARHLEGEQRITRAALLDGLIAAHGRLDAKLCAA